MRRIILASTASLVVATVVVAGAIGLAFAVVPTEQSSALGGVAPIELEPAPEPVATPAPVPTDAPTVAPTEAPAPAPAAPVAPPTPRESEQPESVDPQRPHGLGGRGDGGTRWDHDGDTAEGGHHRRDDGRPADRSAGRQEQPPGDDGRNGEHSR